MRSKEEKNKKTLTGQSEDQRSPPPEHILL